MVQASSLVKEVITVSEEPELCQLEGIVSCKIFRLNVAALGEKKVQLKPLFDDTTFTLDKTVEEGRNVYYYTSSQQSAELVLTFNNFYGGAVHGSLRTTSTSYSIEFLQYNSIHAFKQFQQQERRQQQPSDETDWMESLGRGKQSGLSSLRKRSNTCANHADELTTVYIKFYYTGGFARVTPDVNGFIQEFKHPQLDRIGDSTCNFLLKGHHMLLISFEISLYFFHSQRFKI